MIFYNKISIKVICSLLLIVVSSLSTVMCYHFFVLKDASNNDGDISAFRELSSKAVLNSPINEGNSIVEVISYGCHYCAINDENVMSLTRELPRGSVFKTIHIMDGNSGLSAYAPIFATLEYMGYEEKFRDKAYNAIITHGIDLSDERLLEKWLEKNGINIEQYKKARESKSVKSRINYMAAITKYYGINATPVFIINKRYVMAQDRDFPEFAERMKQLLKEDK